MYAVTISLRCSHLEALEDVKRASREVVAHSLAEPGCLFFDVLFDPEDEAVIRFYEAYRDRASFEAHLKMDHTQRWVEACMPYLNREQIRMPESESTWGSDAGDVAGQRTVVVFGATGKIGVEIVKLLAADPRCQEVRALSRDPHGHKARVLRAIGPSVSVCSSSPDELDTSCAGATDAFIIAPLSDEMTAWHERAAAALKRAEVDHVVKVSVTGARGPESDPPPGRFPSLHWAGEEALRSAGLKTTVIRPTIFMQHFEMNTGMYSRGDHRLFLPTGSAGVAFLDCRDIAAFGHALIMSPAATPLHQGAYELTGPAPVTAHEMVETLSALNKGAEFVHVDGVDAFVARCAELGQPDWGQFVYAEAAEGWFSKVETDVFEQVVGRRPRSFATYASDRASWFERA